SMAHEKRLLKRMRLAEALAADGETEEGADDGQPDRKKTKQEVMKEVIAKSKMHKYERQATKDENDDLREELDRELPDIKRLLWSGSMFAAAAGADPQDKSVSFMPGMDKEAMEKNFDI